MSFPFISADTEDNSPELEKKGLTGFSKKVTLVAAIAPNGERFLLRPKVKRSVRQHGITRYIMDIEPFLNFLNFWAGKYNNFIPCYFHNLTYDLGNLFPYNLDDLDISMVGNRLISARYKNVFFKDCFNLFPMGAKKLGKDLGLEKKAMDVRSAAYVFRDCEIVRAAIQLAARFCSEFEVELPSTLGSLCVRIWQAIGGVNWHCSDELAKMAYYGGRVELFASGGKGNIYYTDINSLYPSVMQNPFPTSYDEFCGLKDLDQMRAHLVAQRKLFGVATVEMNIPKCRIAPLPVEREDGSIFYPHGKISGTYTIHEIQNAIKHGAKLLNIDCAYGSTTGYPYYKKFVRMFYQRRKMETDEGKSLFLKLLMNNLYGQLGMSGLVTRSLSLDDCITVDETGEPILNAQGEPMLDRDGTPYGKKLLAEIQMPLPDHANYLHAAYVTSYARLVLQDYLRKVPADNLIYCDTDSIFFFQDPKKELPFPVGKELGQMKLESICDEVKVNAPKFYFLGNARSEHGKRGKNVYKAKGIPQRPIPAHQEQFDLAAKLMDSENETDKEKGKQLMQTVTFLPEKFFKTGSAQFQMPFRLRESIAYMDRQTDKGIDAESRVLSVWRHVEKRVVTQYSKKNLINGIYYPKKNDGENFRKSVDAE